MRSVSFLLKPGNPCRLAGEREVEIAATVGERRLALLRIWATTGKGQWSCRDTSAINVETLHDLLDRECQRVGFIQDGVALVLEQRRSGGALADVRPSSSRRAHVELDDIDPGLLTALQQLRSSGSPESGVELPFFAAQPRPFALNQGTCKSIDQDRGAVGIDPSVDSVLVGSVTVIKSLPLEKSLIEETTPICDSGAALLPFTEGTNGEPPPSGFTESAIPEKNA